MLLYGRISRTSEVMQFENNFFILFCMSLQSRDAANGIVGMLGTVSGSVLENKLPGEQPSVISTAKLNMAVERSDPDSTDGSSIGDGLAGFQMPSFGKLFGNASSDLDGPVDKQVGLATLFNVFD